MTLEYLEARYLIEWKSEFMAWMCWNGETLGGKKPHHLGANLVP